MREVYVSRKGLLIGRDESNDVNITDMCVSRRHVFVVPLNGNLLMYDLDSKNGTYCRESNNEEWTRVRGVALIHDGAHVKVGDTTLVLKIA